MLRYVLFIQSIRGHASPYLGNLSIKWKEKVALKDLRGNIVSKTNSGNNIVVKTSGLPEYWETAVVCYM